MTEVDINHIAEIDGDGFVRPTKIDPSDMEHYQTDVDFNFTVFLNPIYWFRVHLLWSSVGGYGFVLGPFCVRFNVHRLMRFKDKEENI